MTFKNDQFSADALASAMESVLESPEHKEMFKKQAAAPGSLDVPDTSVSKSTSTQGKGGSGSTFYDDPSGAGTGAMKSQVDPSKTPTGPMVSGDLDSQLKQLQANTALLGVGQNATIAAELLGKVLSGKASIAEMSETSPGVTQLFSALNKKDLGNVTTRQVSAKLNELNRTAPTATATAETDIIDTLVKVADFLGENELILSEAIADNLIQSIIVEAKKKSKKFKKFEKKTKKDMPAECKSCKCDPCECE